MASAFSSSQNIPMLFKRKWITRRFVLSIAPRPLGKPSRRMGDTTKLHKRHLVNRTIDFVDGEKVGCC